jgi:hypothetical protein
MGQGHIKSSKWVQKWRQKRKILLAFPHSTKPKSHFSRKVKVMVKSAQLAKGRSFRSLRMTTVDQTSPAGK